MAYGEVPWRSELVTPNEQFVDGFITVQDGIGLGYSLNQGVVNKHI